MSVPPTSTPIDYDADLAAVASIAAVPTILDVVCRTTGMGFAAVARVTEDRWIACSVKDNIAFDLEAGGELKIETTICHEIRQNREAVVIDHVADDKLYSNHHTPAMYGFQSYISMPIVLPNGQFFGTLCAIDPRPAKLNTPEVIGMFKLFAELIAFHLDAHQRIAASETELLREQEASRLREQFVAVLGHDLRNPLAGISGAAAVLTRTSLTEQGASLVAMIHRSVQRMAGLIDDVLDLARGRSGGGFAIERKVGEPLIPTLEQVVAELRSSFPDRVIETHFAFEDSIYCDRLRISQLFSNLVANALTYGSPDAPIRTRAQTIGDFLEISVANAGEPIPRATMQKLFLPFTRGEAKTGQQGLGLGLYIASEIARAHDGTLTAASSAEETRFTLRIPRTAPARESTFTDK